MAIPTLLVNAGLVILGMTVFDSVFVLFWSRLKKRGFFVDELPSK